MIKRLFRFARSPGILAVVGRSIQYASQLAMVVLIPGALTPDAYVQLNLVLPLAYLCVSVVFGWLMGAIHRYVYELLDPDDPSARQTTFIYFGCVALIMVLLFGAVSTFTSSIYRLIPLLLVAAGLKNSILQILNASSNYRSFLYANIFFAISLCIFISLCFLTPDDDVAKFLTIFAVLDTLIAVTLWHNVGVFRLRPLPRFSMPVAKRYMRYGMPIVANSMAVWVISLSDRYLLSIWETTDSVASYILAYQLGGSIIMIPLSLMITVIFPRILLLDKESGEKSALTWTYQILGYYLRFMPIIFILAAALVLPFRYYVYPAYEFNPGVLLIIILAHVIYGLSHFYNKEFELNGRTIEITKSVGAGAILNVVLNLILIPSLGAIGAAIATLAAYSLTIYIVYGARQHNPGVA